MKQKILLLVVLVALILTGCSKGNESENENVSISPFFETAQECNGEHIEVDIPEEDAFYYDWIYFYKDAEGNSVVVETCSEHHEVMKIQSYPDPYFTKEDFDKLEDGMNVYEVVELVGVPTDSFTSGMSSTVFPIENGDSLLVYWSNWKATSFSYRERTNK